MAKYLNRQQVVAMFKLNILPEIIKEVGNDESVIQHCWDINLEDLLNRKRISPSQKNKWKLKENDLV